MLTRIAYDSLGHANHGWLDARHHFSFANYRNVKRMGFGKLRVINDDIIEPGYGFGMHPHQDMEIITFVRTGAITHRDNQGNEGRTEAGDVQVMSAGTGVLHSEHNLENEATTLYQIWIEPNKLGVKPSWAAHQFPKQAAESGLTLLVSGDGRAPLSINQDAEMYGGSLAAGTELKQPIKRQAYLLVSKGSISVNGLPLNQGDGLEVVDEKSITIAVSKDAQIVLLDLPK